MHETMEFFTAILTRALEEVERRSLPIFTFALYHDHESHAVSVCVDTRDNSQRSVERMNGYSVRHFLSAVEAGDFESAKLWQANIGRSLALGDFTAVNLARTDLGSIEPDADFYCSMVRAVIGQHEEIRRLSENASSTILACSGADDEVALVWSLPPAPSTKP